MTKAPITQALEALRELTADAEANAIYTDDDVNHFKQALKDLQAWVDDVPKITDYITRQPTHIKKVVEWKVGYKNHALDAEKHLLKGIEDE